MRPFLLLSAFYGLTGVALGAFAAHGLRARLSAEYLAVFQTAVLYQLVHALALFGVALLTRQVAGRLPRLAGGFFAVGVLLFSGSLYLLTLTGVGKLGIVTPLGGTAFMAGWACLLATAWRLR